MKTYFRLLSFAKPIEKFAIPYIIFTLLYVIFSSMIYPLLVPLLNTLFIDNTCKAAAAAAVQKPTFFLDISGWFKFYMDYFIRIEGRWGALKYTCSIIVLTMVIGNLFRYLAARTMENLRVHTLLNLRRSVFNNIMDMHLGYFNNNRKGDIISKIASDVQVVQFSVTATLQVIFKEPATMIVFLVLLFTYSVKLTLGSLLVVPISAFIISKIVKRLKAQAISAQQTYGNMISYLDESLQGVRIIKAFNATDFIKKRFDDENFRYSKILRSMAKRQQSASPVSETLAITMISCIVLYGGYLILNKKTDLTGAQFIAYIAIFSQLMRPAKAMSDSFSNIHSGIAAGERVLALIDEKPAIKDKVGAKDIDGFKDSIEFKNVSFAYDGKDVLSNINLTIPKGKTVALVGPSGGGKSTLIDLIPHFTEPQSGEVCIDGNNINDLTAHSLRSLLGVVNQESILFNDSIFNNIAFGKSNVTMEEVVAAAKIANAHNFIIETEKSYETNIGDRGAKLSGGQRQRICIARAVLNNPPIMLLDEATSALDTESEKLVQDALNNLMKNRTSLIIAHRLSTIQNADIIVVLENGQIVEQGNHQQLIENNGLYRKLIDMQTFNAD
ncbi:ABC transporter ATP-binding protein/permease [Mucilaginibacter sp. BJC16-A38]|uniref:ABC transporter ATP-binding protein n=1 Tax=Mucilaginibacter phenanthrenivorans TaxID=1234842 RepID=UPI002157AB1A|nr:ABC transporter ATP-binding protein [Mucilaginibacter phenanthrenivorans]MCR8558589.1 ABC transporter ATP-binding protein/permease [Mucilaginibacter phenanthrenivorans]